MNLGLQQLQAIADLSQVGYSVVELSDPSDAETWVIRYNNQAASTASQMDLAPLVGKRFLAAFPAIRGTPFIDWYRQVLSSGQPLEVPEIRYGDEHVPEAAYRVWLSSLPGNFVLGQYVNVTLQRRAEGRLRKLNASLEQQVAERTAELQASRQVLREVTYASAHDLKSPLRHLQLYLDQLRDTPEEDLGQVVDAMSQALERGVARLDSLIEYTELSSSDGGTFATIELQPVIEEVVDGVRGAFAEAEVVVDTTVSRVTVVAAAFRTVLRELVRNALLYRRLDAPDHRVEISAKIVAGKLQLRVRDNGVGIPSSQVGRIFQAFYRGHPASTYAGVGIGLAVARVACETAKGSLSCEDAPGSGAIFVASFLLGA